MTYQRPIGRCVGCFHDFETGPCGGCGAVIATNCTDPAGEWYDATFCHENDDCPGHSIGDLRMASSRLDGAS